MRNIDISDCPVIDAHCHPYPRSTEALKEDQVTLFKPTLLYNQLLHELSRFLSSTATLEDVIKSRNRRSTNYLEYQKELFHDAGIETLIIDTGFPPPLIDIDDIRKIVPVRVAPIFRLEVLIKTLLERYRERVSGGFEDLIANFTSSLEELVVKKGYVGFKSLIAYRTGLNIRPDEIGAKKDFEGLQEKRAATLWFGPVVKKLRDYLTYCVIQKSIEMDVPVQFHTGIGDQDIIIEECNPIHLFNLLKDEKVRQAKIVLCHAGYPYVSEAACLTSLFPNVYMDLHPIGVLGTTGIPNRVVEILERAPHRKILYESDGHLPEFIWMGAKLAKRALSKALRHIVDFGTLDENEAEEVAELILFKNAKELYKL